MSLSLRFFTPTTHPSFLKPSLPAVYRRFSLTFSSNCVFVKVSLDPNPQILALGNSASSPSSGCVLLSSIKVDAVMETELKENGFRSTRRTKLICTIRSSTCGSEQLEVLAIDGMNVARINMCHGTREWPKRVLI